MKSQLLFIFLFSLSLHAQHRFGWKPDTGGTKDTSIVNLKKFTASKIAAKSDLENKMPEVYDQGNLGSCTANGTVAAFDYLRSMHSLPFINPSRLFEYYNTRVIEGTVNEDNGAQIRNAVKAMLSNGSPKETTWPYLINKFNAKPTKDCYTEGVLYEPAHAYKCDNVNGLDIRRALSVKLPVIIGVYIYNSIYEVTASKPILKMPRSKESPIGGHCMLIVGHDDSKQLYKVRNSWGKSWGVNGYLFIPYAYIHSARITDDCWVIDQ